MIERVVLDENMSAQKIIDVIVDGQVLLWEGLYGIPLDILKEMDAGIFPNGIQMLHYLQQWNSWVVKNLNSPPHQQTGFKFEASQIGNISFSELLQKINQAYLALIARVARTSRARWEKAIPMLQKSISLIYEFYHCYIALDFNTEPGFTCTAREIPLFGLESARRGFIRRLMRIPYETWIAEPQEDRWSLRDIIGHVCDWEIFNAQAIKSFQQTGMREWEITKTNFDNWNSERIEIRRTERWQTIFRESGHAFRKLHSIAKCWPLLDLYQNNSNAPKGWREYPYGWLTMSARHYLEHFEALDAFAHNYIADVAVIDNLEEAYIPDLCVGLSERHMNLQVLPTYEIASEYMNGEGSRLYLFELALYGENGQAFFEKRFTPNLEIPVLVLTRLGYDKRHWLMKNIVQPFGQLLYKPAGSQKIFDTIITMLRGQHDKTFS